MYNKHRNILIAIITGFLLFSTGCSLFKHVESGKVAIPEEPQESKELNENIRKNVDYAESVLSHVYHHGTLPYNDGIKQAQNSLKIVKSQIGNPRNPINLQTEKVYLQDVKESLPAPEWKNKSFIETWFETEPEGSYSRIEITSNDNVVEAQEDLRDYIAEHQAKLEQYNEELREIRQEQMGKDESETISSPFFNWLFSGTGITILVIGVALLLIAPTVFIRVFGGIVEFILNRFMDVASEGGKFIEEQFGDVVESVQDYFEDDNVPEEEKKKLKKKLKEKTRPATKQRINKIKTKRTSSS